MNIRRFRFNQSSFPPPNYNDRHVSTPSLCLLIAAEDVSLAARGGGGGGGGRIEIYFDEGKYWAWVEVQYVFECYRFDRSDRFFFRLDRRNFNNRWRTERWNICLFETITQFRILVVTI